MLNFSIAISCWKTVLTTNIISSEYNFYSEVAQDVVMENIEVELYINRFSLGCLSPRKVYWAVKTYEKEQKANLSTEKMISELIWRDFFQYMALKHKEKLFSPEGKCLEFLLKIFCCKNFSL